MSVRGLLTCNNDGSTFPSPLATVVLTLPAGCVPGDVVVYTTVINATAANTATTPTGHTRLSGPDQASTTCSSYLFTRVLDAGDISAGSFTVTYASTTRPESGGVVLSGLDATTPLEAVPAAVLSSTSFATSATASTTVASSDVLTFVAMRALASVYPAASVSGYTTSTVISASTSGSNTGVTTGYRTTPGAAGSYGGDSVTTSPASSALVVYTVATRKAAVAFSGSLGLSGAGTLALTGKPAPSGSMALSGSGTLSLAGKPAPSGSMALSGSGSLSLAGTPAVNGSMPLSGSGTLGLTGTAGARSGSLGLAGSGTLALTGKPAPSGSVSLSGSGSLSLTGRPNARDTLSLSGSGTLALTGYLPTPPPTVLVSDPNDLTYPFLRDTTDFTSGSHRQVYSARANTSLGWVVLDVESCKIRWDETNAPRVKATLTCVVPDQNTLDALDARLPVRVEISAGYVRPGGKRDLRVIANLGLRSRRVSRPDNKMTLEAASDEARVLDNASAYGVTLTAASVTNAMESVIRAALDPDPVISTTAFDYTSTYVIGGVNTLGPTPVSEDVSDRWSTLADLADRINASVYDDGLGTWHIESRPEIASTVRATLKVGSNGTIESSDTSLSRDDGWYNRAFLKYRWRDVADVEHYVAVLRSINSGPYATSGGNVRIFEEERNSSATLASANLVAANLLTRFASRGRSFSLTAVSMLWLRPGHTITVQLPIGAQERHLVASVEFDLDSQTMAVVTRLPVNVTTTSGE